MLSVRAWRSDHQFRAGPYTRYRRESHSRPPAASTSRLLERVKLHADYPLRAVFFGPEMTLFTALSTAVSTGLSTGLSTGEGRSGQSCDTSLELDHHRFFFYGAGFEPRRRGADARGRAVPGQKVLKDTASETVFARLATVTASMPCIDSQRGRLPRGFT